MDLYIRKIIGRTYDTNMSAELALKAVKNACLNVDNLEEIVLQSDLGTQYTSDIFEKYLASNKIRHSYRRKGCPNDNACIEFFHSLIKKSTGVPTKVQKKHITASLNISSPGIIIRELIVA